MGAIAKRRCDESPAIIDLLDFSVATVAKGVGHCCEFDNIAARFPQVLLHCSSELRACSNMGTILSRKRSNGTPSFLASIRLTRDGKIVDRGSQAFDRREIFHPCQGCTPARSIHQASARDQCRHRRHELSPHQQDCRLDRNSRPRRYSVTAKKFSGRKPFSSLSAPAGPPFVTRLVPASPNEVISPVAGSTMPVTPPTVLVAGS